MSGNTALEQVAAGAGSLSALARALGLSQSTVWDWKQAGRVPICHVKSVQRLASRLSPPVRVTQAALAGLDEDSP